MTKKDKKNIHKIVTSLLLITCMISVIILQMTVHPVANERYFAGEAKAYCEELIATGFPEDYAVSLTELHLLHPTWEFVPLQITKGNAAYTWDYVIAQETKNPETNLISASDTYSAYRHPTNLQRYDSGYYQASPDAVRYFMDPRNFLSEADLFLFFDLSVSPEAAESATAAVLQNTFMEHATLENGMTFVSYFCKLGKELGINPVYLAAKVRQEQGVGGTSPLISGKAGDKLLEFYTTQMQQTAAGNQVLPPALGTVEESTLTALNGYYNFFNVKASGTGLYTIYKNATERAVTGTDSMAAVWGGSPSWNTKWKSLYGGAWILKNNYIDCYQSTVYLQKFNVDSRSDRNFWGQYMQAVSGGLTEARSLYQSLASIDALELPYTFLIPVYEGMPQAPCADPANGTCTLLAKAATRYSYQAELTEPTRINATSGAVYTSVDVYPHEKIKVEGVMTHSYGIVELQYAWDGSEWQTASSGNQFKISQNADFSEGSTHILVIRGRANYDHDNAARKHNSYFLCAVIYVSITPPPQVTLTYEVGNTVTARKVYAGAAFRLPESDAPEFAGWLGSDGSFLPSGATCSIAEDVTFRAIFLDLRSLAGAALSVEKSAPDIRFSAVLDQRSHAALTELSDRLSLKASVYKNGISLTAETVQATPLTTDFGEWVQLWVSTPPLTEADYDTPFYAVFCATFHYTDGTQRQIFPANSGDTRTARQLAALALADANTAYSPATLAFLETVAG